MFNRFIRPLFRSLYTAILFSTALLCGAIWYFGPLLPWGGIYPLETIFARAVTTGVLMGLAIFVVLLIFLIRRRRNKKMTDDIVASVDESDTEDDVIKGEMEELRTKLKSALTLLRKSKLGRKSLYELPWYVMIGPPGAGKTTAIVNSGLKFPLAEEMGKGSIGGVGGTRNCDWWFTDAAVLIDTAGRYTTQESDAESDNAGWLGFLNLLKKHRKRQPINGALIAISLSDLSMQDEVTQASHAKAIRRRLHELREKLGVRFPVYVLFTKGDLIAGFAEFFDNMGKDAREQVWGFTFPLDKTAKKNTSPIALFDDEFSALLTQLNTQSLERMQAETDHQRRSLIAGFPGQVASVRQVARDFLNEVFLENKFEHRHMLRGVYFTSGTQEGTPIDRLMMGMARTFGIGRQAIGSGKGTGRSYFLTRLFEQVVFKEAGLVSADDKVERRYRWIRRIAIAATVLIAVTAGALWTRSFLANNAMIADATERLNAYQAAAADIPSNPIADSDLISVIPALNILYDMPINHAKGRESVQRPEGSGYGLYQGDVLGDQAAQSYRAGLNQHFLPRLLLRLEDQIQGNINNPDILYETLKVYLMLGQQGPMNTEFVTEWMNQDWNLSFSGPSRQALRDDLNKHLQILLSQPMQKVSLNGPLVEQAQTLLAAMPMAQRIYNGIINSPKALELPSWRIVDVGGPAVTRALVRSSGKPLTEGVEGIFTYRGFNTVFLEEALSVARRIQNESWVLGPDAGADQSDAAILALTRDVLDLYYNDYTSRYEGILSDVDIIPMESLRHAVEVTNILAGPTSPIVNLLNAIADETKLTEDRSAVSTEALSEGASAVANLELKSLLSVQAQTFLFALENAETADGNKPKPPGQYVEERFSWLHELVKRPDGQNSQLDELIRLLDEVYREMSKLSFSGVGTVSTDPENSAIFQLTQATARLPGPMQRWTTQITTGSSGITADGNRSAINAKWQSAVLPFCEQAFDSRYPFNRRSSNDVGMQDFARMFAPGGMLDVFFEENLAKFVDTTNRPWVWKRVNDADLGISPDVLLQFEHAAAIRAAFFTAGANPAVSFQITPEALDPKATSVKLEIDGTTVEFAQGQGQPAPAAVQWPGAAGFARVVFEPASQSTESQLRRDGPWGWFRLLDAAEIRRTNVSDKQRVIFNIGGRIAIFQMQSGSSINPFALPSLGKFSCPKSF
ncbi:type VI secretion system membrane subunit TssM [Pseudorhodobacter sp. E13]|uniref:type VI secretion system membrane subunit TssM n=1 Tax=Pseudorhodobacter sp. E13 TaxID=2487931 RepID=UPI000F8E1BB6|nr:type VI secretion system membrane subunit TssM [Pseudorhodobacter sp. E13]RUS59697.1 type VI secretion system membrane subunit TssM [Pseudorhodobacter sp. E13]